MVNLRGKGSYNVANQQVLTGVKRPVKAVNNKIIKRGRKKSAPVKTTQL